MPRLSIIINTHNRVAELDKCLNNLYQQTYKDFEVILIDMNTNLPGLDDLIKKFSNINHIKCGKNLGPSIGRNIGVNKAEGELLVFLDDDAYLLDPLTLDKTIRFFDKNDYGQLGLQSYENVDTKKIYISQCIIGDDGFLNVEKSKDENLEISNERLSIETSFCLMKKKLFQEAGGFDPIYFFYDEDTDLSMRIGQMGYKKKVYKDIKYQHTSGSTIRSRNSRYFNKGYLVLKNFGLLLFLKNLCLTFCQLLFTFSLPKQRDNFRKFTIQLNLLKNYFSIKKRFKYNFLGKDIFEKNNIQSLEEKKIRLLLDELNQKDEKLSENANKTAFVYITNRCNAKCEHCFYWDELNKDVDEMSLLDYKNLSNNFKDDVSQVIITGGEPFLRKEIDQISKYFLNNQNIHSLNFITNGVLPDRIEEKLRKILSYASRNTRILVNVSIDGLEEVHDKIRRVPGIFKKLLNTIENLKRLKKEYQNLQISALTTISRDNFHQFKEISNFVERELKIYQRINIIRSPKTGAFGLSKHVAELSFSPEWVKPFDLLELSEEQHKEVLDFYFNKSSWRDYHKFVLYYSYYIKQNKKKFFDCSAPEDNLVIYPNGDLTFCEYSKTFTNVKNAKNFSEFFHNDEANKFRKLLKSCSCDHPCNIGGNLAKNKQLENILPPYTAGLN